MSLNSLRSSATAASSLLKAAGNPHRLMILCDLAEGELSVGQLEERLELSQSALSQHLAKLRQARLVRTRRCRQTIYYALDGRAALLIMTALSELYRGRPSVSIADAGLHQPERAESP